MYDDQTPRAINHIHKFLATNEHYQQKVTISNIRVSHGSYLYKFSRS